MAGLIAGGLQQLGDVLPRRIEAVGQRLDAGDVAVLAGEDHAAAGRADGVRAEAVVEAHALLGDAVDVGRLVDLAAIGADGVRGMVVRHDVQDVRTLRAGPEQAREHGGSGAGREPARGNHGESDGNA